MGRTFTTARKDHSRGQEGRATRPGLSCWRATTKNNSSHRGRIAEVRKLHSGVFLSGLAVPKKSAKPTTDSSPPIHRWDRRDQERQSVKRTAEPGRAYQSSIDQSSVSRTGAARDCLPSTEVLGYFHSSASRTKQDKSRTTARLTIATDKTSRGGRCSSLPALRN